MLDENGIVHGYAYEQECAALNALGDEIGHLRMYQNGYYHKYDQGMFKNANDMKTKSYLFEMNRTNIFSYHEFFFLILQNKFNFSLQLSHQIDAFLFAFLLTLVGFNDFRENQTRILAVKKNIN